MGLFHLGTTGEAPSLSHRLRKEIMTLTLEQVEKKVPVLVGRTDTSFAESINIAEYAEKKGASAVVLAPPYYFPVGESELLRYLEDLVPKLPLGWNVWKSLRENPFCSEMDEASASHNAIILVVEEVGAKFKYFTPLTTSSVLPLKENAMIESFLDIIPKSPWKASLAWTKKDGIPKLENVAAHFFATCPDLPSPRKMTLPSVLEMTSAAALNASLKDWSNACKALISFCNTFLPDFK
jgi:hypothetical protein